MQIDLLFRWSFSLVLALSVGYLATKDAESATTVGSKEQTAAVEKAPELSIPYNEINIEGKNVPLNIQTLASIQRLTEESELKKRVLKLFETKPDGQAPAQTARNTGSAPAAKAGPKLASGKTGIATNTVLSVYGAPSDMRVEIFSASGKVSVLTLGGVHGDWVVAEIDPKGVLMRHRFNSQSSYVAVGKQIGAKNTPTTLGALK